MLGFGEGEGREIEKREEWQGSAFWGKKKVGFVFGWVWFGFFKLGFLKKLSFQKMHNEKVFFQKAECLVKDVKKCFLKKLSVWLVLIKVAI